MCALSLQGSGDVLFDMEQQLESNHIRIQLLEDENTMLRNSLVTLNERYISTMVQYLLYLYLYMDQWIPLLTHYCHVTG